MSGGERLRHLAGSLWLCLAWLGGFLLLGAVGNLLADAVGSPGLHDVILIASVALALFWSFAVADVALRRRRVFVWAGLQLLVVGWFAYVSIHNALRLLS